MKKIMTAVVSMGLFLFSQAISLRAASAQGVQVVVSTPQPFIVVAPRPEPVIVVAPAPRVVYVQKGPKQHHDNGHHKH